MIEHMIKQMCGYIPGKEVNTMFLEAKPKDKPKKQKKDKKKKPKSK